MKKVILRILGILLLLILLVALFVAGCRLFLILSTKDRIRTPEEAQAEVISEGKYDAIIVLGAGVWRDRTPSPILRNRLDLAVQLYQAGISDRIIVTGDHRPGEYDEVDVMWEYLIRENVPVEHIERDYKGFSTYESMVRVSKEYDLKRAAVITQHFHLYRAMYIAKENGLDVRGVIAETVGSLTSRAGWTTREWVASIKDLFYCLTDKEIPQ